MTDSAAPCLVIVGARARDGGRSCGHLDERHEPQARGLTDSGLVKKVCLDCRFSSVPFRIDLPPNVAGCDHPYTGTVPQ